MNIDRSGTFRVKEIDRALGQTAKQNLPQLAMRVAILEYYNAQGEAWEDYSKYGMEANAYFVLLYTPKGKSTFQTTLSYDQLMKVFNWDGRSFEELTTMDAPEVFMIRVEDNDPEYADKTPFVVNWIDNKDADPRGGLKKLDTKAVKALDKKFSAVLNKSGKPATAKKAPSVASKKAEKPAVPKKVQTKSERVKESNEKLRQEVVERDAKRASVPPEPVDKQAEEHRDSVTKQEAWEFVIEMGDTACTDEQRTAAWRAAIQEIAGEVDEKEITPQQWHKIMHKTLDDTGAI